jgi:hypothetical protein
MGLWDSLFGGGASKKREIVEAPRAHNLDAKIRKLRRLGYRVRVLHVRGVRVLRASLPAKMKLKSKHPFRSIQVPTSQAVEHLEDYGI